MDAPPHRQSPDPSPRGPALGRAAALAAAIVAVAALVAGGCGSGGTLSTGRGQDGGGLVDDAGATGFDAGGFGGGDAGTVDAGGADAGGTSVDAGSPDAGAVDAGRPDAGGGDGGVVDGGFGAPNHGYPSWRERAFLVLANAARMAPAAWRDTYMTDLSAAHGSILDPAHFPAQPPLHFFFDLARSARAHAADMANNCGLQHDSCNGTRWSERLKQYDPAATYLGENVAAGDPDPRRMLDFLLCDAPSSGAPCCADTDTSCNGHRQNIMDPSFTVTGTGYAQGTQAGTYFWTEDLADNAPPDTGPIVAASHALLPPPQQYVAPDLGFFLNYADPAGAPSSVTLYLAGTAHPMSADLGPANQGTYVFSTGAGGNGAACQLYHFEAVDSAGHTWRYPASGSFATAGIGACPADQDWVP